MVSDSLRIYIYIYVYVHICGTIYVDKTSIKSISVGEANLTCISLLPYFKRLLFPKKYMKPGTRELDGVHSIDLLGVNQTYAIFGQLSRKVQCTDGVQVERRVRTVRTSNRYIV